jgi:hypothetical protein
MIALMATKRRKTAPRYAVNISLKAWDIAHVRLEERTR